jgi:hypothetical protein
MKLSKENIIDNDILRLENDDILELHDDDIFVEELYGDII